MLEIYVDENIAGQRLDRFVRKFLDKADLGFIYRMIRRGNIEVNGKKSNEKRILELGDSVKFWMADETINKFKSDTSYDTSNQISIDIIYEDNNILVINKPSGIISHSRGSNEPNIVDSMIQYLISSGSYKPEDNPTFVPGIVNRLDFNTSGIIIGCKNYQSLRAINNTIKKRQTKRYYTALVKGKTKNKEELKGYLTKDKNNTVVVSNKGEYDIITNYCKIKGNNELTLVEIDLVTGRTHQIRAHMAFAGHPVIGDNKYGDAITNKVFQERYNINRQLLHCSEIKLNGLSGDLEYLNNIEIKSNIPRDIENILKGEL